MSVAGGYRTRNSRSVNGGRITWATDESGTEGLFGLVNSSGLGTVAAANDSSGVITDAGSGIGTLGEIATDEVWVQAGATIAVDDLVYCNADRKADIPASGDTPCAIARSPGADGGICKIQYFGEDFFDTLT